MHVRIRALPVLAAVGLAAACGGTSPTTTTSGGVATNPPSTDIANTTASASSSTGSAGPTQTSGDRTILAPLGLNLRDQPALTAHVIGSLGEGTVVTVVGNNPAGGGWYNVQGETKTGWITADPQYSTSRHMTSFASTQHGFSTLYPDTWSFVDNGGTSVVFAPQSGGVDRLTVVTGANAAALGAPGRQGYAVSSGQTVEVFGVTGSMRIYDRGAGVAPGTSAPIGTSSPGASPAVSSAATPATAPGHIAEISLTVNAQSAMRVDYEYSDAPDLDIFTDIYHSMKIYAALPTPSPGTTATGTATAST